MTGRVWLVGAGPGAPDLLTLRAIRCLQQADVVIYDRLIQPAVLDFVRPGAECIDVGKQPRVEGCTQQDINALLVEHGQRDQRVVRLKGGDPFVFGRGGEELQALAQAGIPFEIVPGLSSALAAPAAAGIPLTHRGLAQSFTVATGTGISGSHLSDLELETLARTRGTLVLLMAMHRLDELVGALMHYGRPRCDPAAIVMHATWPTERVVRAELHAIAELARLEQIRPPAILIVGPTVNVALPA